MSAIAAPPSANITEKSTRTLPAVFDPAAITRRVQSILMALGSVGVWGTGLWLEESRRAEAKDVAAELDELGYAALWLSAGFGHGLPAVFADLLDATTRMGVASGILTHLGPDPVGDQYTHFLG